ncbi:YncE family protein [Streptomyces sp. RB6PN25]|uniref:YncE family protein n=1 Tax=Streptomyces humicola TaxID=2953240 RepID=A0ABT1PTR5_9ACTN|nr:YncE family protein [Streptomyces humicola]MCQ4081057.1 YncE family protein [Streptomyces humicola]
MRDPHLPPPLADLRNVVVPGWLRAATGDRSAHRGAQVAGAAGIYRYAGAGMFSPAVAGDPQLVYVPNSGEPGMGGGDPSDNPDRDTVTVIDPKTFKIVAHFPVGTMPQHVTPSWDLKTLWVDASGSNQLVPINPRTAKPGKPVPVGAPYNLYFTPDGNSALAFAERRNHIEVLDPRTMRLRRTVAVPCRGINHADFSADGTYFITTCEFSGQLLKYDTKTLQLLDDIRLGPHVVPQDIRLGPDGHTVYVASFTKGGVIVVDGTYMKVEGFIATGAGTHGIYPSRDGRLLYVSNRNAGTVSVIDPATRKVTSTWTIPGGGSPDMGSVSADGTQLWLSGRNTDQVYVFSTHDGHLLARIRVGANPHGLAFFPQPGRYSVGHTGNYR